MLVGNEQVSETAGHKCSIHTTSVSNSALLRLWEHTEGLRLSSWRHPQSLELQAVGFYLAQCSEKLLVAPETGWFPDTAASGSTFSRGQRSWPLVQRASTTPSRHTSWDSNSAAFLMSCLREGAATFDNILATACLPLEFSLQFSVYWVPFAVTFPSPPSLTASHA